MIIINCIKVMLAEKNKTYERHAGQMGKDLTTVSKWHTNIAQLSLEILIEVANMLNVNVREFIAPTNSQKL